MCITCKWECEKDYQMCPSCFSKMISESLSSITRTKYTYL